MDFYDIFLFLFPFSLFLAMSLPLSLQFPSFPILPFDQLSCHIALRLAYIVPRVSMVYHFIQSIYNCSRALLIHLFFAQMKRAYSGQELFLLHFELIQFRLFLCALCKGIRVRSCIVNEYNALSFIIFHCITFGDISNKTRGKTISHWTIFRIVRQIQIVRVFV